MTVCGSAKSQTGTDMETDNTLVYGSNDYIRINPAMDEHGEINALIFNGLTAHNDKNEVIPALAKGWEFDDKTQNICWKGKICRNRISFAIL